CRRSISGVGLLAQDLHRGHHHRTVQPQRRRALCSARHGVALPIRPLFGVGGWMALRLYHGFHIPFEIDLLAGGIAASVFGVIFGLPALRMRGLYFALITLMIAAAFQVFINA